MQLTMSGHYYFGRVLSIQGDFIQFKFLHPIRHGANAADSFDWPRRDDVDNVHMSCVFYGPVQLVGNTPFTVLEHEHLRKFSFISRSNNLKGVFYRIQQF